MARPSAGEWETLAARLVAYVPIDDPLRGEYRQLVERASAPAGRAPYGWRWQGGELVEVPEAQKVIRAIVKWRSEGHSPREIARALNALGDVRAPSGGRWHPSSVENIATRAEPPAT
jgi:hypothetical protein